MDIRAQILAEIAEHRGEIEKLEIALAVVERMEKQPAKKAAPEPLFTVRRAAGATPRESNSGRMLDANQVRKTVLALLAQNPARSGDLIDALRYNTKQQRQQVYGILNVMMGSGAVERDPDNSKLYRLPQKAAEPEPEKEIEAAA